MWVTRTVLFYWSLRQRPTIRFRNTADPNEIAIFNNAIAHAKGDGEGGLLRSGNSRKSLSVQEIFKFNSNVDAVNRESREIRLNKEKRVYYNEVCTVLYCYLILF